ncbi:hypothetical protein LUZ60_013922 [Juncus effusus]|nr:hypothetical protein LUZ60_013922 [Juncus effusus]
MGLLDKLWDDTVAGPRPDTGLSRLRKQSPFTPKPLTIKEEVMDVGIGRPDGTEEEPKVTRSIMIKRPAGCPSPSSYGNSPVGNGTPPLSPAGSTPPLSPFYGGGGRFRRKSLSDAYERAASSPKSKPSFEV